MVRIPHWITKHEQDIRRQIFDPDFTYAMPRINMKLWTPIVLDRRIGDFDHEVSIFCHRTTNREKPSVVAQQDHVGLWFTVVP